MGLFDTVSFGPADVRAAMNPESGAPRRCVMAVLTSQTCGEPCWHAREEVCRCSCGGRNHGCLLIPGGERPERTAKIDGDAYRLLAVGLSSDLHLQAAQINGQQWARLERPEVVIGNSTSDHSDPMKPRRYTMADYAAAIAAGEKAWVSQGYSKWRETDKGAPARIKFATKDQLARWTELTGWQDQARIGVAMLWQRLEMPHKPTELRVNREGVPLVNQIPNGEQI